MHSRSIFILCFLSVAAASFAPAQTSTNSAPAATAKPVVLDPFVVTGDLDQAREEIVPALGGRP
jgi:hypothetical protein